MTRSVQAFIAAIAVLLGTIVSATPALAQEFPSPGVYHGITPQAPSWSFGDSNGSGSVQVDYSTRPYNILLGYKMSPQNIALCDGGQTLNETIDLVSRGRVVGHDNHTFEACDYQAHPVFQVGELANYEMKVLNTFRVTVNGAVGTATLRATANFAITLV